MSRTYPVVYSVRFLDQGSPEQWTSRAPTTLTTVERSGGAELVFVREDGTEVLVTELLGAVTTGTELPSATWDSARFQTLNVFKAVAPATSGTGWGPSTVTLSITAGALPTGVALITDPADPNWGEIRGTPTAISSGNVTITGTTLFGTFEYYLPWTVADDLGISVYTNSIDRYPQMVVHLGEFENRFLNRTTITGSVDGSWVFTDATAFAVYYLVLPTPINGRTHAYVMKNTGDGAWYIFASSVPLSTLAAATNFAADFAATGIVATNSGTTDFTDGGVTYPSSTEVCHVSGRNYINFGQDVSLAGFMSRNNSWSFGAIAAETIPADLMGRVIFGRGTSNFLGWKERGTVDGRVVYGRQITQSTNALDTPHGDILTGQHFGFTFNGGSWQMIFYVDGVVLNTDTVLREEWDADPVTDFQDLWFGRGATSNILNVTENRFMTFWQGLISDLWVANGTTFSGAQMLEISGQADLTVSANYGSITHHWPLSEVSGATFTAAKGGVNGTGEVV